MEERNFRTYPHDLEELEPKTTVLPSIADIMKIFPLLVGDQRGQMVTTVMEYEGEEIPLHFKEGDALSYGKHLGLNIGLGAHSTYTRKEAKEYGIWLSELVAASSEDNEDIFAWVSISKYDLEDEQIVEEVASLHWMISGGEIFSISRERFLEQESSYFEDAQMYQEYQEKMEMQRQMEEGVPSTISLENQVKILKILFTSLVKVLKGNGGSENIEIAMTAVADKFEVPMDEVEDALAYALEMQLISVDESNRTLNVIS